MACHTYAELEGLWIQAGGNRAVAPIMAAIAMAESGGCDIMQTQGCTPPNCGAGIWQITPPETDSLDSATNAQQAVAKYNSQGLSAWTTYTGGAYKQFYNPGVTPSQDAQAASSSSSGGSASPSCCVWSAGSLCMDGLIGWSVAVLGVVVIGLGGIMAGKAI